MPPAAQGADVVILGEVHDNPDHHRVQAEWVAALSPAALVFEMIEADTAEQVSPVDRADQASLSAALGWAESGWPDFAYYYPIFSAAPGAALYGAAVPRSAARRAMQEGAGAVMGDDAAAYGLLDPLDEAQQTQREALQQTAHCNALPPEMLPGMVAVQRLRDAMLARAVMQALDAGHHPVVVITGNGHARQDWGVPAVLATVAPDLDVFTLGQTEAGAGLDGGFDQVQSAPSVDRGDPCAAFRSN